MTITNTNTNTIPLAVAITNSVQGANDEIYLASRVKTFYQRPGVDDGKWYQGVVKEIYPDNKCSIEYDEGFTAVGDASCVWVLKCDVDAVPILKGEMGEKCEKVNLAQRSHFSLIRKCLALTPKEIR